VGSAYWLVAPSSASLPGSVCGEKRPVGTNWRPAHRLRQRPYGRWNPRAFEAGELHRGVQRNVTRLTLRLARYGHRPALVARYTSRLARSNSGPAHSAPLREAPGCLARPRFRVSPGFQLQLICVVGGARTQRAAKCGTMVLDVNWGDSDRLETFCIAPDRTIGHAWPSRGGWHEMPGGGHADGAVLAWVHGAARKPGARTAQCLSQLADAVSQTQTVSGSLIGHDPRLVRNGVCSRALRSLSACLVVAPRPD
jgi:hypothetical protein